MATETPTPREGNPHTPKGNEQDGKVRYEDGWRAGKPVEDPHKTKSFGFVIARPSEYLICVRDGQIDAKRSGQGAHVFKWPWESIAVVPTTLQKIEFKADQITKERVGVQVIGIAVYRIAVPALAFRVLNFSYTERASEKLSHTLSEMFVGAARRLIANLTLEECLMKRKEAIASFLMQEIGPVVSGTGDPDDATDRGWGVVIDTIEIQDVHILSHQVFESLQSPFRSEIAMKAELAELERKRQVAERQAETDKRMIEARLGSERETRMLKAKNEAEAAEIEAAEALKAAAARARIVEDDLSQKERVKRKQLEMEQNLKLREIESTAAANQTAAQLEQQKQVALIKGKEERRRIEAASEQNALKVELLLAEERHGAESRRLAQERERRLFSQSTEAQLKAEQQRLELEMRRQEAEIRRLESALEAERARMMAEIEQVVLQQKALLDLINTGLPKMAQAFQQSFGTIHYTQLNGGAESSPLNLVSEAFAQILTVAKGFGLDPARLGIAASPASQGESSAPDARTKGGAASV